MFTTICGIAVGVILIFGVREEIHLMKARKKRRCQEWATKNLKRAEMKYSHWVELNPYANSSHPEAQRLQRIKVGAYMLWLDAHDMEDDDGRFEDMLKEIEDNVL